MEEPVQQPEIHEIESPIQRARIKAGLTREACALAVGVRYGSWCAIELGHRLPRLPLALRIARLLNSTVEELFGEWADDPNWDPVEMLRRGLYLDDWEVNP